MAAPRRYHGYGTAAVGTNLTLTTLISATTIRPALYDLTVGCSATPADQATRFGLLRCTAAGTAAGNFTPIALDPGDPASAATNGYGVFSVEPTYTANSHLLILPMNQRATVRWVAAPGGELQCPATAANGIGVRSISATGTATHEASIHWME